MKPHPLFWTWEGEGQWSATSAMHDAGCHFEWDITVCDDGSFDLSESDSELLQPDEPRSFKTFAEAKAHCEKWEESYQRADCRAEAQP